MSSNQNSGYLARDDSITPAQNNSYFQHNNAFSNGFDSSLSSSGHELSGNDHWNYDPDRLDVGHGHDPSPSLYQGWQSTSHQPNLSTDTLSNNNHNAFYPKTYANNALPYQTALFGNPTGFNRQSSTTYDAAYTNHSTVGTPVYDAVNSAFSNASVQSATIAPGALQQRPTVYRNASTITPHQQSTSISGNGSGQEPQKPLPRGTASGHFVIITPESLAQVTTSKRLHNFVDIGTEPFDVWSTKSTIPSYLPRKSRNEISRILANSSGVTSKITKKPLRRASESTRKLSTDRTTIVPRREISKGADVVSSSDDDPSDDDSDSDESEEESMQAPLPAVRPSKAIEAVKYDTIKTLWRVPYRSATADDIRKGLAEFWDIVRTIRDRWKSDIQSVKDAEEAKKVGELPLLNERVSNQREMLEEALNAAISQGHKDIVEHLAENVPLVLALAQFLRDRAASGDYSGTLSKSILELLSRCKTLTDGVLEKTSIAKVLPRFLKRGDDSIKALAKRVNDNGTVAAKKKQGLTKNPGSANTPQVNVVKDSKAVPTSAQKPASPASGVKRPRASEASTEPPAKRTAGDVAASSNTAAGGQLKAPQITKRSSSSSDVKSQVPAAPSAAPKKATQVVAKPSSFFANNFSGLQSAKKSTISAAAKPATQAKAAVPSTKSAVTPAAPKPVGPAPRPLFSIADTLASVSRPREVEVAPKREESAPLETSEEKIKRLRKEQRRKLRVSFKPDDVLVSFRFLTPPLEDEQGANAFDARDAGDIDSEGRMFKLHHDDMDVDEEDDVDVGPLNDLSRAFRPPSLVDFSTVPEEDRQRAFAPYGGGAQKPECPEAEAQERREANTLIAVYARASDIPPTPKEPTEAIEAIAAPKEVGIPPDWVLQRLEALRNSQKPVLPITPLLTADLAKLLSTMPQPQPMQPVVQPQQPPASTDLEKIFAQFSQGAQAPAQAPAAVVPNMFAAQPQQQQQPNPFLNLQNLLGTPTAHAQAQAQQVQGFQQPSAAPVPGIPENLSAMLASLQQSGPLAGMMAAGMPDFSQYAQQQQQQQQQQNFGAQAGFAAAQQQQQQYPFENPERRRWIENGGGGGAGESGNAGNDGGDGGWQGKSGGAGGNKGAGRGKWDPNRAPPKFVVQCKYWKEGKCRKGAECTYLHTG